jgi:hypothetical protein
VRAYLYYRSSLDQAGDDVAALTNDDALWAKEDLLVDALDEFWPLSSDPVPLPLTIEPLHPLNSAEGPPTRKEEDDIGLLRSHTDWEVRYVTSNTTPSP